MLAPPPPKREYEIVENDFVEGDMDGKSSRSNSAATDLGSGPSRLSRGESSGSMAEGVKKRAEQRRASLKGSAIEEGVEGKGGETYRTKWDEIMAQMGKINVNGKRGRQKMREAVQLVLGELEERCFEAAQVRCISWGVGKGTWKINHVNKLDDVEVVFTGLKGAHDFKDDGSMVSSFDLENFFVRSYKPGPESIVFSDPTSVVRNEISSFSRTPCQRCGVSFDPENNNVNSCTFHANEDGEPGTFLLGKGGGWTCCGETWEGAPGCNSRPHIGKELAIVATIESLPKLKCGASEVSIYKHIGFTFYPGVKSYVSNMQITRSVGELFMAYFMGEGVVEKGGERGQVGGGDGGESGGGVGA